MKSMLLNLSELSKVEEVMVEELKQFKVPSYFELLHEDLLKKLYFEGLALRGECRRVVV